MIFTNQSVINASMMWIVACNLGSNFAHCEVYGPNQQPSSKRRQGSWGQCGVDCVTCLQVMVLLLDERFSNFRSAGAPNMNPGMSSSILYPQPEIGHHRTCRFLVCIFIVVVILSFLAWEIVLLFTGMGSALAVQQLHSFVNCSSSTFVEKVAV